MSVVEEFLIAVEEAEIYVAIAEEKALGGRIWRWVKAALRECSN